MHPVLIVMSATFDYFIYFSIPYRLNRIKKTDKEIEYEAKQRLKALKEKAEGKAKKCCCIVIKPARKKKSKKTKKV